MTKIRHHDLDSSYCLLFGSQERIKSDKRRDNDEDTNFYLTLSVLVNQIKDNMMNLGHDVVSSSLSSSFI
jgi:hypothetical protein